MTRPLTKYSRLGFIGAGRVGGSMAVALSRAGYPVVAIASRSFPSASDLADLLPDALAFRTTQDVADRSDVLFVTTPDDAMCQAASDIQWRPGQGVVHCSGVASLDVFDEAVAEGAVPGAIHPMQAVSSIENGVESFPGTTFGIEADGDMKRYLGDLAEAIGGNPLFLRAEDKAMYHLTGVLMGNLLTALGAVAAQLWETFDFTRADGVKALAPMMRQVSVNLDRSGLPAAIAGPYVRGDVGTVRKHLDVLRERAPQYLPLYCELALAGLPFAQERGPIDDNRAAEIREMLEEFRAGNRHETEVPKCA